LAFTLLGCALASAGIATYNGIQTYDYQKTVDKIGAITVHPNPDSMKASYKHFQDKRNSARIAGISIGAVATLLGSGSFYLFYRHHNGIQTKRVSFMANPVIEEYCVRVEWQN
jgi:hypothetical protein